MTNDKDGAALLREALRAAIEWIDAIPPEIVASLPVMPGFDRDWLDEIAALQSHGQAFDASQAFCNNIGRIPTTRDTIEAVGHTKALAEYAYKNGFHELGYDPVSVLSSALSRAQPVFDAAGVREAVEHHFPEGIWAQPCGNRALSCGCGEVLWGVDSAACKAAWSLHIEQTLPIPDAPANVVDREITTKPDAVGETAVGVTQGAASVEPVAWLLRKGNDRELEWASSGRLTDADKAWGWTETPLYARPEPDTIGSHSPGFGGGDLREALSGIREWIAALTVTDMNELVADGGLTAGMLVGQEASEQLRRLDMALAALPPVKQSVGEG